MKPQHILIAILVSMIWGGGFSIVKIGLNDFPPIFNVAIRFTSIIFPFIFFVKCPRIGFVYIVLLGLCYTFMFTFIYLGIYTGVSSGLSSLILQSTVLFSVLLSIHFFNEKINLAQAFSLILGFFGIFFIAIDSDYKTSYIGFFIVLFAAFFNGLCSIIIKKSNGSLELFPLMIWSSIIPPIPLFILSYFFESNQIESLVNISFIGVFSIYYTSFIATVLAFMLWGGLLSIYPVNKVAPFNLLIPFFGFLFSYILLGEEYSSYIYFSFFLISLSLAVLFFESSFVNFFKNILR